MPTPDSVSATTFLRSTHPLPLIHSYPAAGREPFEVYRRLTACAAPSFLLESGKGSEGVARYSFLGHAPSLEFIAKGTDYEIRSQGRCMHGQGDPFSVLWDLLGPPTPVGNADLPPFLGGAVGFFGYDLVRQFERLPNDAREDMDVPDLHILFVEQLVAFDHVARILHLIYAPSPWRMQSEPRDRLYREGRQVLADLAERVLSVTPDVQRESPIVAPDECFAEQTEDSYQNRVRQCQSYIEAGHIYQANLSHRFTVTFPEALKEHRAQAGAHYYRRVSQVNPSPFSALLAFEECSLVSNSPERLLRKRGQRVDTRPIAGTYPRGGTVHADRRSVEQLLVHPKERAEHIMLVDLARNDLGRVCRYGTVHVDELLAVERYSHVFHLESTVSGLLQDDVDNATVFKSVFPGGTITGVPKIHCMELIDRLEPVRRGPYTGSIGYISWTGDMDWNIVIRTLVLTDTCGYLQVGAGIVADSIPAREYRETLAKAQAFFQVLRS